MDPYIGEIRLVGFNYAPPNWAFCDGTLLPIQQYTPLFALLGTQFGGNGVSTFGLPDLRGRAPIFFGQGPGLQNYVMGQAAGSEMITLSMAQMPTHNHSMMVDAFLGTTTNPLGNHLAQVENPQAEQPFNSFTTGNMAAPAQLGNNTIATQGQSQPHDNRPPYLTLNFIIALTGIYPARQ